MTAQTDLKLILEKLLGRSVTTAAMGRIGAAFVATDPHSLADFADPSNPTNEEQAQLVLDTFRTWGKQVMGHAADNKSDADSLSVRDTNRASAQLDF